MSHATIVLLTFSFCLTQAFNPHSHAGSIHKRQLPDYAQRNLDTIRSIYNLTVWPNNAPIVEKGAAAVPDGLFNQDATGRVSPVGNFSGFEDSIEYFFSLAPVPAAQNGLAFYAADVVEFTSGCAEVASSLVYLRTGKIDLETGELDKSKPVTTLAQVAFWRFDSEGKVLKYHAWIPNLSLWTRVANGVDFDNPLVQKFTGATICPIIQKQCTGPNAQYNDILDCTLQLSLKDFGSFDEPWGDNVACRIIHLILTKVRPEVHCPHVGPKGGSPPNNWKCVDVDYTRDYFDDGELFGAEEGSVFTCGGPLLGGMAMP